MGGAVVRVVLGRNFRYEAIYLVYMCIYIMAIFGNSKVTLKL